MPLADEIAKLHELLNRGALTQAEFEQAKARLLGSATGSGAGSAINRLRRSRRDRWIGGVCGGLAGLTGLEGWVWRLAFVLGLLLGGVTLFIYAAMWVFVPEEAI
jgi:phage shock protein PspC (stress-responsive transcriptional regulator)